MSPHELFDRHTCSLIGLRWPSYLVAISRRQVRSPRRKQGSLTRCSSTSNLPTDFDFQHHPTAPIKLLTLNIDYHTNRPLQQSADVPVLSRPISSRHLSQIPPRQLPQHSLKLPPLSRLLTTQYPKLYPFPSNGGLSQWRFVHLPPCQSLRLITRL